MKLFATLIAAVWVILFVGSVVWINDVPRKPRMFESPELRGNVDYGFPLVFGSVEFVPDFMSDETPSRLLHSNVSSFQLQSIAKLLATLGIGVFLAILNFWGIRSVCRDSVVVSVLCAVTGVCVGVALLLCLGGAILMPNDMTLLDEAAMLVCVIWLAFAIVSLQQLVEGRADRVIESLE